MSCGGALSPVLLTAAAGLLQNSGLKVSDRLSQALATFNDSPVAQFNSVVQTSAGQLSTETFESLQMMGDSVFPAVTNSIPAVNIPSLGAGSFYDQFTQTNGLTGFIEKSASTMMGNGDLSKFTQMFQGAQGYAGQVNSFVNSAVNSRVLDSTFSRALGGMDSLITAGVSQINEAFGPLGQDLQKLGGVLNFSTIESFGLPSNLLQNLVQSGGLPPELQAALRQAGVSPAQLTALTGGQFPSVSASANKFLYGVFGNVTGPALDQVKSVLGVTTPGINSMADLLDVKKIFPSSYPSMTTPTPDGLRGVFLPDGSINSRLEGIFASQQTFSARPVQPGVWDWATVGQAGQDRYTLYNSSIKSTDSEIGTTTRFVG